MAPSPRSRGLPNWSTASDALLFIDAVHYAPHRLPDVEALGADLLVFSPYKVFGPHLGVLYLAAVVAERFPGPGLSFFDPGVGNWEPGMPNLEGITGFGGTLEYLDELGCSLGAEASGRPAWQRAYGAMARHESDLCGRLLTGLRSLGVEQYGLPTTDGRVATVSFNLPGRSAQQVADGLADHGVGVGSGHHYAFDLVMEHLGLAERGGTVRASLVHYSSAEEVDRLLAAVEALAAA